MINPVSPTRFYKYIYMYHISIRNTPACSDTERPTYWDSKQFVFYAIPTNIAWNGVYTYNTAGSSAWHFFELWGFWNVHGGAEEQGYIYNVHVLMINVVNSDTREVAIDAWKSETSGSVNITVRSQYTSIHVVPSWTVAALARQDLYSDESVHYFLLQYISWGQRLTADYGPHITAD